MDARNAEENGNGNGPLRTAVTLAELRVHFDHIKTEVERFGKELNQFKGKVEPLMGIAEDFTTLKKILWAIFGSILLAIIMTVLVKEGIILK
jgi:hypothetical protein